MDKEIEEIARVILEASCYGNECEDCSIIETVEEQRCCVCVKALYNAGYRKIDENCAVITKAELKEYKRQAVKEFAEKLKANACRGCIDELIEKLLKEYEE